MTSEYWKLKKLKKPLFIFSPFKSGLTVSDYDCRTRQNKDAAKSAAIRNIDFDKLILKAKGADEFFIFSPPISRVWRSVIDCRTRQRISASLPVRDTKGDGYKYGIGRRSLAVLGPVPFYYSVARIRKIKCLKLNIFQTEIRKPACWILSGWFSGKEMPMEQRD